jgi:nitrate/TMAO reductase-like tetraheme cytochrome c subunit
VQLANCAQCHLRTGKSKKSGLPYPTNFVAGDNLFRDFEVDLSDAALARMNPGDRHVAQNVREVLAGKSTTTCVNCHDIHRQNSTKHRQVVEGATCISCHDPGKPRSKPIKYEVHSALCEY